MACDLKVNARGRNFAGMQADLEGMVPLLTLNGQAVSGITVNGRLQRDLFNGHLECDDPYLQLTFDGLAESAGALAEGGFHRSGPPRRPLRGYACCPSNIWAK